MASKQLNLSQFLTIRLSNKPSRTTESKEKRISIQKVEEQRQGSSKDQRVDEQTHGELYTV